MSRAPEPDASSLPADWAQALRPHLQSPGYADLQAFVRRERAREDVQIFPPASDTFRAFALCPRDATKVVVLGQDPYHGAGQAHGLAFSVREGVKVPPSLRNIFKERHADLGLAPASHGDLSAWATRGVLLLNTVLTVREGQAHSHKKHGWEDFTDAVIDHLSATGPRTVFVLWGGPARKKATRIDRARHAVVEGPHPSPLSAHRGFFGSRPFSAVDAALASLGRTPMDWRL